MLQHSTRFLVGSRRLDSLVVPLARVHGFERASITPSQVLGCHAVTGVAVDLLGEVQAVGGHVLVQSGQHTIA